MDSSGKPTCCWNSGQCGCILILVLVLLILLVVLLVLVVLLIFVLIYIYIYVYIYIYIYICFSSDEPPELIFVGLGSRRGVGRAHIVDAHLRRGLPKDQGLSVSIYTTHLFIVYIHLCTYLYTYIYIYIYM